MGRPSLRTPLCELLDIEYPIVLAGMGAFALPQLVATVSNAGGLGVLGATSMAPAELREAIRHTRQLTTKPFGVDVILPLTAYGKTTDASARHPSVLPRPSQEMLAAIERLKAKHGIGEPAPAGERPETLTPENLMGMVEVTIEERVPVFVSSGLGNPGELVPAFHQRGVRVMALVGNVRNARRVVEAGVDVVIARATRRGAIPAASGRSRWCRRWWTPSRPCPSSPQEASATAVGWWPPWPWAPWASGAAPCSPPPRSPPPPAGTKRSASR